MTKPLLMELKELLSDALNSEKTSFRQKALSGAMELMSELEMNDAMAEKALKLELGGEIEKADAVITKILEKIDTDEYSDTDEKDFKKTYTESED